MKVCPKCKVEHNKKGIYCSRKCSNSRTFTEAARNKKRESNKKHWNSLSEKDKQKRKEWLRMHSPHNPDTYLESLLTQDWNVLGIQGKRIRVILEQNGQCNKCGISEWNKQALTLEYEHKDGNNTNNSRNNVEALCPNCHSQTKTWRGRKNKKRQDRVEKFLKLYSGC